MYKILYFSAVVLSLYNTSCKSNNSNQNQDNKKLTTTENNSDSNNKVEDIALVEPVKKIIYYLSDVDITTYDSISTQYFHAVVDYTDTIAIKLKQDQDFFQAVIDSDTVSNQELDLYYEKLIATNSQLAKYHKEVIGYVFVHTFMNKGDTMSAIILTNSSMTKGQAIPVKKITDIEPDLFTSSIRKIEQ